MCFYLQFLTSISCCIYFIRDHYTICLQHTYFILGLNTHLVPILVKIIPFGPYFRCLFNLVLILVKSHSIESFWQTELKLLTVQ